jgi:murein DD-endopeptidase MepM/ murein hydrolase activator NlpD
MFEAIVQGGGQLTQGFGATAYAAWCGCEWTCPSKTAAPGGWHAGIDIWTGQTPGVLLAVGAGQVTRIGRAGGSCGGLGPNAVCIRSGSIDVWYGHCSKALVTVGQWVSPGQPIAWIGSLGCSTGRHVHYEIEPAGLVNGCLAYDPWAYVSRWPGTGPPAPAPVPAPSRRNAQLAILAAGGVIILAASLPDGGAQ